MTDRHNDPHRFNTACTLKFAPSEDNHDTCGQCGATVYSCDCGRLVNGDGARHVCTEARP